MHHFSPKPACVVPLPNLGPTLDRLRTTEDREIRGSNAGQDTSRPTKRFILRGKINCNLESFGDCFVGGKTATDMR